MDNEQMPILGDEDEIKSEGNTGNLNVVKLNFVEGINNVNGRKYDK